MPKCVLVVDDDRLNTELVKRTLIAKGYEVLTASDGEEALACLKKSKPDVILLDVQMPVMDGYAFILQKARTPEIAPIPVIVLSAMEETAPLFKRHGVKAYLPKPLNTPELLSTIEALTDA
jgi:CheY-like chemotaxis protein